MSSQRHRIKVSLADGSEKLLRFDGNALAELEDLLDRKLFQLMHEVGLGGEESLLANFGFREIRALLYTGLKGGGTKLKLEQAGALMATNTDSLRGYLEAIFRALSVAMRGKLPEEIAEEAKAEAKAKAEADGEANDEDEEVTPKPNPT